MGEGGGAKLVHDVLGVVPCASVFNPGGAPGPLVGWGVDKVDGVHVVGDGALGGSRDDAWVGLVDVGGVGVDAACL